MKPSFPHTLLLWNNLNFSARSETTPVETISPETTFLITEPNGYAPEAPVEKMPFGPASANVEQDGDHQEANVGETEFPGIVGLLFGWPALPPTMCDIQLSKDIYIA